MMENVIEKHYVPTSGSGLDANLVAALMNNNNKSLDPATVALLRDNDKGLETAALANGGGMFGGAAMWNNPFMYLVWMTINMILHPELIKKYFSHPKQLLMVCKDHLADACKILEGEDEYNSYKSSSRLSKSEEMDYNFHLAKVCCILCDYFKTEGLNPESYLNEVTRYKREER